MFHFDREQMTSLSPVPQGRILHQQILLCVSQSVPAPAENCGLSRCRCDNSDGWCARVTALEARRREDEQKEIK